MEFDLTDSMCNNSFVIALIQRRSILAEHSRIARRDRLRFATRNPRVDRERDEFILDGDEISRRIERRL